MIRDRPRGFPFYHRHRILVLSTPLFFSISLRYIRLIAMYTPAWVCAFNCPGIRS